MRNKQKNPEINDMHLIWEDDVDLIMMICSNSQEYMVFDEHDPEESKLLRRVLGGHSEEITICAYDFYLSLVATGCINGEITIYDFEMSKIEGILIGHGGDITAMEFLSPYPLLISASMDATVCIWGVRPCPTKFYNVCIKRYINMSWDYDKDVPAVVSRMLIWKQEGDKGIKKYRRLQEKQLPATTYRDFEQTFVFSQRDMEDIFRDEFKEEKEWSFNPFSEQYKLDKVVQGEMYAKMLLDEKAQTFVTQVDAMNAEYMENIDTEMERLYLYVGDDAGYLKIWDLNYVIKQVGVEKVKSHVKANFNPRRQELVNCTAYANQYRKTLQDRPMPPAVEASMTGIIIREVVAHRDSITSLSKIKYDDCSAIISASRDCFVRTWSLGLDLLG